jgi:predicted nucleotidyltransferase component of viral defense system
MKPQRAITNVPASVRQRLYNRARAQGEDFNLIVSRYAVERLLYRLGKSQHAEEFVLKGALQIDVGFGDVATPAPKFVKFPSLLDFPAPRLKAYQRETVVAEKFHALVTLGMNNSRFKDFYDLFVLAKTFPFDGKLLSGAIQATFKRRKTALPRETPIALTGVFANDSNKQKQWQAFLMKNRVELARSDFARIVDTIRKFLLPPTTALVHQQKFRDVWPAGGSWRKEESTI